jgi:hypothetical protein
VVVSTRKLGIPVCFVTVLNGNLPTLGGDPDEALFSANISVSDDSSLIQAVVRTAELASKHKFST